MDGSHSQLIDELAFGVTSLALIMGALKTLDDLPLERALGQAYARLERADSQAIIQACAVLATVRKILHERPELEDYRTCPECHRKILRVKRGMGPDFYCSRCIREL
jgi:Zn finger protein HypA/HybF involved in hydrogenase expression